MTTTPGATTPFVSDLTVSRVTYYRAHVADPDPDHQDILFFYDRFARHFARAYFGTIEEFDRDRHTLLVDGDIGLNGRPLAAGVYIDDLATAQYVREVLSQLAEQIAQIEGGVANSEAASTLEVFVECLQRRIDGQAWAVLSDNGTRVLSQFLTRELARNAVDEGYADPRRLLAAAGDRTDLSIELRPADPTIPIDGAYWSTTTETS